MREREKEGKVEEEGDEREGGRKAIKKGKRMIEEREGGRERRREHPTISRAQSLP